MSGRGPTCRADLFELARLHRRKLETLYTLSNTNDPWMVDIDRRRDAATWLSSIFERFDIRSKVHARAVHYRLVSQDEPVLMPNGEAYVNTYECFNWLCNAIRDARYRGDIDTNLIIDNAIRSRSLISRLRRTPRLIQGSMMARLNATHLGLSISRRNHAPGDVAHRAEHRPALSPRNLDREEHRKRRPVAARTDVRHQHLHLRR